MRVLLVLLLVTLTAMMTAFSSPGPWMTQANCRVMPPIEYPKFMPDIGRTQERGSQFTYRDRDNPQMREVASKMLLWAVKPVTMWYRYLGDCPVYAGWGSAVALETWKTAEGDFYTLWATVHHVAYPMQYETERYVLDYYVFDRIEIEGYDLLPLWQNNEVVFALSREIAGTMTLKGMMGDDYVADEVFIGEMGVGLGFTIHANFKEARQYLNLYHFPVNVAGEVMGVTEIEGMLGADFTTDLNGMSGMSGGPYFVYRKQEGSTFNSFRLAGIANIGAASGILGYYMIPSVLKDLRGWWESGQLSDVSPPQVQTPSQEQQQSHGRRDVSFNNPQGFFLPIWKYPPTYERP